MMGVYRKGMRFLRSFWDAGRRGTAYIFEREAETSFKANTVEIDSLKQGLSINEAKLIAEFVKDLNTTEAAREASILSRAQALLVGQALIASIVALGGSAALGKGPFINAVWTGVILILVTFVVGAGLRMIWCALQALSGQGYPRLAMEEFREALKAGHLQDDNLRSPSFQSVIAVHSYNIYRKTVLRNDWRFERLAKSQWWFFASILFFSILAVCNFIPQLVSNAAKPPVPTVVVVRMPSLSLPTPAYAIDNLDIPVSQGFSAKRED